MSFWAVEYYFGGGGGGDIFHPMFILLIAPVEKGKISIPGSEYTPHALERSGKKNKEK
jgi:hypothetical protein